MFEQLGLIGCGLMGGSLALAAKRAGVVKRVVGYSASPQTTAQALQLGVIDAIAPSAQQAAAAADWVVVAVPVAAIETSLAAVGPVLAPQALLMDVGSTKADVVASAARTLGSRLKNFVPTHPMAGKEVAGIAHADAHLYAGRTVILTPTDATDAAMTQRAQALWQALGCRVLQMTPNEHDSACAAISHLPHLLAFAFMNGLAGQSEVSRFLDLAGPGFRDFTRIAASDETVWRDILLSNREQVLAQSRQFRAALTALEDSLQDANALVPLIGQAAQLRRQWGEQRPPAHAPAGAD